MVLNNIGLVHNNQGQYEQALDFLRQALTIRRDFGDRAGEGRTLNNIGLVYDNQEWYERALYHYQLALSIQVDLGDRTNERIVLKNIGDIYYAQGQSERAIYYFQQTVEVEERLLQSAALDQAVTSLAGRSGNLYINLTSLFIQKNDLLVQADDSLLVDIRYEDVPVFVEKLVQGGVRVYEVTPHRQSLEQYFLTVMEGENHLAG